MVGSDFWHPLMTMLATKKTGTAEVIFMTVFYVGFCLCRFELDMRMNISGMHLTFFGQKELIIGDFDVITSFGVSQYSFDPAFGPAELLF